MIPERSITRRRFSALTGIGVAIAALAGCTEDEGDDGNGSDEAENGDGGGPTTDENGEGGGDDEDYEGEGTDGEREDEDALTVEGTNLFVRVVDGERIAIEGATVTIAGGAFDGEERETDADGRVIELGVESGEYTVTVSTGGEEQTEGFTLEAGDDESLTFAFSPPSEEEGERSG